MVECNVSFEVMVLQVPSIPIVGEGKDNHIIKSSNQTTTALQSKQPVEHQADIITRDPSVAPGISADNKQVNEIMKNLENNPSDQPLRQSTRLNLPTAQNLELELRHSECLKEKVATGVEDYNAKVMLAMTSIVNQIIDSPTVGV